MLLHESLLFSISVLAGLMHAARESCAQDSTPWQRHIIDGATDSMRGADGVRLADANGDGLMDMVTPWEEGNAIRVCLNPGPARVEAPWPVVTVGRVSNAEDAVFADLDGDGRLDVVSCTEGRNRTIYIHWAPTEPAPISLPKRGRPQPFQPRPRSRLGCSLYRWTSMASTV